MLDGNAASDGPPTILTRRDMRPMLALAVHGPLYASEIHALLGPGREAQKLDGLPHGGLVVVTKVRNRPDNPGPRWVCLYALNTEHEHAMEIRTLLLKMAEAWPPPPLDPAWRWPFPPTVNSKVRTQNNPFSDARLKILLVVQAAGPIKVKPLYKYCRMKYAHGHIVLMRLLPKGILKAEQGKHRARILSLNEEFVAYRELDALLAKINRLYYPLHGKFAEVERLQRERGRCRMSTTK